MKPFLSFDDQLNTLKNRHLKIKSDRKARDILKSENYYRLSGYFKMFTKPGSDDFVDGFSMKKLIKIYQFDADLRLLLDGYIAKVEIAARTRIAYNLAKETSPDSYYSPSYFVNLHYHQVFISKVMEEIGRNSSNPMINRFQGDPIPIWVIVEILSFGAVSKMYANLKPRLRRAISNSCDYQKRYLEQIYSNNLLIVCNLRNICAHHGRLYGKRFPYNVSVSNNDASLFSKYGVALPVNSTSTAFHLIFALCNLMYSNQETNTFVKKLKHLFSKYKKYIDIRKLGFGKKWFKLLNK